MEAQGPARGLGGAPSRVGRCALDTVGGHGGAASGFSRVTGSAGGQRSRACWRRAGRSRRWCRRGRRRAREARSPPLPLPLWGGGRSRTCRGRGDARAARWTRLIGVRLDGGHGDRHEARCPWVGGKQGQGARRRQHARGSFRRGPPRGRGTRTCHRARGGDRCHLMRGFGRGVPGPALRDERPGSRHSPAGASAQTAPRAGVTSERYAGPLAPATSCRTQVRCHDAAAAPVGSRGPLTAVRREFGLRPQSSVAQATRPERRDPGRTAGRPARLAPDAAARTAVFGSEPTPANRRPACCSRARDRQRRVGARVRGASLTAVVVEDDQRGAEV